MQAEIENWSNPVLFTFVPGPVLWLRTNVTTCTVTTPLRGQAWALVGGQWRHAASTRPQNDGGHPQFRTEWKAGGNYDATLSENVRDFRESVTYWGDGVVTGTVGSELRTTVGARILNIWIPIFFKFDIRMVGFGMVLTIWKQTYIEWFKTFKTELIRSVFQMPGSNRNQASE